MIETPGPYKIVWRKRRSDRWLVALLCLDGIAVALIAAGVVSNLVAVGFAAVLIVGGIWVLG